MATGILGALQNPFKNLTLKQAEEEVIAEIEESAKIPTPSGKGIWATGAYSPISAMGTSMIMSSSISYAGLGMSGPGMPEVEEEKKDVTELNWKKPKGFKAEDTKGNTLKYFDNKKLKKDLDKALKTIKGKKDKNKAKTLLKELNALKTKLEAPRVIKDKQKVGKYTEYEGTSLTMQDINNAIKSMVEVDKDPSTLAVSSRHKDVYDVLTGTTTTKRGKIRFKCPNCSWKETIVETVEDSPISMSFNAEILCPNCKNKFVDSITYKTLSELI